MLNHPHPKYSRRLRRFGVLLVASLVSFPVAAGTVNVNFSLSPSLLSSHQPHAPTTALNRTMALTTAQKNKRKRERKKRERAEAAKRARTEAAGSSSDAQAAEQDDVKIEYVAEPLFPPAAAAGAESCGDSADYPE